MKQTRLIDANGLMNLLERELDMNGITDWGKGYMDAIHDAMEHVKFMPTIETDTVKHGSWFILDECANEGVYCSVCHKKVYKTDYANQKIKSKYCPNCGAIMDLEENKYMEDEYKEPSVCDDCEIGDGWECYFCCSKCYEDYGECPNPDCDPMDI